jgi:hypothetical protein
MTKRRGLAVDQEALAQGLKGATGQGVGALFSQPDDAQEETQASPSPPKDEVAPSGKKRKAEEPSTQSPDKTDEQTGRNPGPLPFDEADIEALREPASKGQTFRVTAQDIEWLQDTAYRLSKEKRHGKVAQSDILRIGLKLFENLLARDKAALIDLLEEMR